MACHLAGKQTGRLDGGMKKFRSIYRERGLLRRSGTLRGLKRGQEYGEMQRKVRGGKGQTKGI